MKIIAIIMLVIPFVLYLIYAVKVLGYKAVLKDAGIALVIIGWFGLALSLLK